MTISRIPSIEGGIQPTLLTAKGDLISATAASTPQRLAVGSDAQILVADSSTATGLKWAAAPTGKIIQVVYGSTSSAVSSASSTYIDTNLSATITPTSATSTILVMVAQQVSKTATASATSCNLRLYRGATNIRQLTTDLLYTATTLKFIGYTFVHNYVDSPATTSATTYKTMFMNPNSTSQIELQDSGAFSTMVLMEIGA